MPGPDMLAVKPGSCFGLEVTTAYLTTKAIDSEVKAEVVPSVTVKITLESRLTPLKIKLSVCVQPPLALTRDKFILELGTAKSKTVVLAAFLKGNCSPADLEGSALASYSTPTGIPRLVQCKFRLPLKLVCFPAQPSKMATQKLTIDTNKPSVSLDTLFPDFPDQSDDVQTNALGFQLLAGSKITLLASKTSREYKV
ncbi:UNVERIFIED_CONTAM: hypothetical protein K2H54_048816 [Gekko kuhli]